MVTQLTFHPNRSLRLKKINNLVKYKGFTLNLQMSSATGVGFMVTQLTFHPNRSDKV